MVIGGFRIVYTKTLALPHGDLSQFPSWVSSTSIPWPKD